MHEQADQPAGRRSSRSTASRWTSAADDDPRQKLVDWMVDPKNPFFARAVANRYWAHFFGRGIVDPLDDMRVTNPPSNPELLDALAQGLGRQQVQPEAPGQDDLQEPDVPAVARCRTSSTSTTSRPTPATTRSGMSAEVLFDAVCQVTDSPTAFGGLPQRPVRPEPGDHAAGRVVRVVLPGRVRPAAADQRLRVRARQRGEPGPGAAPAELATRCRTSWPAPAAGPTLLAKDTRPGRREGRGAVPVGVRPQADRAEQLKVALDHIDKHDDEQEARLREHPLGADQHEGVRVQPVTTAANDSPVPAGPDGPAGFRLGTCMGATVHLLTGPPGPGLTARLLVAYLDAARDVESVLWLAPTERAAAAIVRRMTDHDSLATSPNVVSVSGFAQAVLVRAIPGWSTPSQSTRRMLLDEVVGDLLRNRRIEYFRRVADTRGFFTGAEGFLDELVAIGVSAEEFSAAIMGSRATKLAACADLVTALVQRGDAESTLRLGTNVIRSQPPAPFDHIHSVFVDGCIALSPGEWQLLEALAQRVDLWLAIPSDEGGRDDAFAIADQVRARFPSADVVVNTDASRGRPAALAYLERHLFGTAAEPATDATGLHLIEAPGPVGEARLVARRIRQLLISGVRPDDVVVTARSLAYVGDLIDEVFDEYGIPVEVDGEKPLASNPAIATLLRASGCRRRAGRSRASRPCCAARTFDPAGRWGTPRLPDAPKGSCGCSASHATATRTCGRPRVGRDPARRTGRRGAGGIAPQAENPVGRSMPAVPRTVFRDVGRPARERQHHGICRVGSALRVGARHRSRGGRARPGRNVSTLGSS